MKIFICIKQVPDPNTTISKLDPTTKRLVRNGVSLVLDPGDESTIAAAIKLRDTLGNSELVALSMGPTSAQEAMRRAQEISDCRKYFTRRGHDRQWFVRCYLSDDEMHYGSQKEALQPIDSD